VSEDWRERERVWPVSGCWSGDDGEKASVVVAVDAARTAARASNFMFVYFIWLSVEEWILEGMAGLG